MLLLLIFASQVLFGTGLSNVRALMAFHVPRYQKIAGMGWVVMALIALYFQAAKGQGLGAEAGVLFGSFFMAGLVCVLALGCGAPLKRVINNEQAEPGHRVDGTASRELPGVNPIHTMVL